MISRHCRRVLLPCLGVLVLAGCASGGSSYQHYAALSENDAHVTFTNDGSVSRVGYFDSTEYNEYAAIESASGQGEAFFAAVLPTRDRHILEFDRLVADTIRMWRFNRDADIPPGDSLRVETDMARFWVRPYRRGGIACFGYTGGWQRETNDPDHRPRRVLFGYYCRSEGADYSPAEMTAFVNGIRENPTVGIQLHRNGGVVGVWARDVGQGPALRDTAAGSENAESGLSDFPLLLARRYTPSIPSAN